MNKNDLKLSRVEFDERGFAKENGYVRIAHFDEYGFFSGIEDHYQQQHTGIPAKSTRLLPTVNTKEDLCWRWNGSSWFEEDITKRPVIKNSEHIPAEAEAFSPTMWRDRQERWVQASHKYNCFSRGGFEALSIQNLMQVEEILLDQEEKLKAIFPIPSIENSVALGKYQALSGMWVMALYEIVRHLRNELKIPEVITKFSSLFDTLNIIRMPLAKHVARKISKAAYPSLMYNQNSFQAGWYVRDYKSTELPKNHPEGSYELITVYRREIADLFLDLMNE